ncbi:DNA polymerase lambda-like [Dreissena polymorpha]|nr:DNA polymerase lambda-like [Dreissena polymorpha]
MSCTYVLIKAQSIQEELHGRLVKLRTIILVFLLNFCFSRLFFVTEMGKSKRSDDDLSEKIPDKRLRCSNNDKSEHFLFASKIHILQAGIEKLRMQIFYTNIKKYGGELVEKFDLSNNYITHLVVDDNMEPDRMCRLLKIDKPPENIEIVKSSWLSKCFKEKVLMNSKEFILDCSILAKYSEQFSRKDTSASSAGSDIQMKSAALTNPSETENLSSNTMPKYMVPKVCLMYGHKGKPHIITSDNSDNESDYCPSDGEQDKNAESAEAIPSTSKSTQKNLPVGNWVCAQSSKMQVENPNKHITDKLEEMVKTYESTNDKWRAFGYQKAIQALRKHPKRISTYEEAMSLPSVGKRLAEKIWEIVESGDLRKLNEFKSSEEIRVIEMFKDVWGAGPHTARTWYQQGLRTLEDLRTKANLTHQQKVGLRCYHDFLDRMPRAEAAEIEKVVVEAAESLQEGVLAQACGSYRRGKATCGDVDVLVTHPDGKSHRGLFGKLLAKLKKDGFLTDDLVTAEDNGNQKKYLGVCKLPGENSKHRRLDIIVVPYDEYACALVYFTGSAHFNRSLRHLAKKMGMSLSEHSLNVGVVRNGTEKIYEGTPVPTPTEESVFIKMGIPFRPPDERDH